MGSDKCHLGVCVFKTMAVQCRWIKRLHMKKMTVTFFSRRCLAVLDGVRARRETVIITKRGKAGLTISSVLWLERAQ